jgi:hypothetical protein
MSQFFSLQNNIVMRALLSYIHHIESREHIFSVSGLASNDADLHADPSLILTYVGKWGGGE